MKRLVFISIIVFLIPSLFSCRQTETSDVTQNDPVTVIQVNHITPADSPALPERGFYMGTVPSPAEGQSFEECYRQVSACADFVPVWGRPTPFYSMAEEFTGAWGDVFIMEYTRDNDMFPLFHMSFIGDGMSVRSPDEIPNPTLSDQRWRDAYKQAALDIVTTMQPRYLSLGNEVNRWYEEYGASVDNPNSFSNFVSLYKEIYDAVKELSPDTLVFCTFSREIVSEYREADMTVLALFDPDKLDLLVLTSYPHAVQTINRPSDIPDNYYVKVTNYFPGKPLGFSEIAWPSMAEFGGEESQADFINDLCDRLIQDQGIELHLLGWPWLHDLDENDYIGLIKKDGTPKLAYDAWKAIFSSGE